MMRINLLPIKAARKQDTAKQELLVLAGVLGAVLVGLFVWNMFTNAKIDAWNEQVRSVQQALETQKKDVQRVQEFKAKAELVERKVQVIDGLKAKKVGPAMMLDALAALLTENKRVWLVKLEEKSGQLTIEGNAMGEQDISDFQIALAKNKMFQAIKLGTVAAKQSEGMSILEWKMTITANYSAG